VILDLPMDGKLIEAMGYKPSYKCRSQDESKYTKDVVYFRSLKEKRDYAIGFKECGANMLAPILWQRSTVDEEWVHLEPGNKTTTLAVGECGLVTDLRYQGVPKMAGGRFALWSEQLGIFFCQSTNTVVYAIHRVAIFNCGLPYVFE